MSKEKILEASRRKNRSQAKDQELEWDPMFNSNSEPRRQWSEPVTIPKQDYIQPIILDLLILLVQRRMKSHSDI